MIILGVDTALRCTGYGVVEMQGKRFSVIDCGVIKNDRKSSHSECLRRLAGGIRQVAEEHPPDVASIEGSFYFKNAKTAMVLGMARGTVISTLATLDIQCYEYAPTKAKQAITGYGRAPKDQVAQVMSAMLTLNVTDIPDDSTDALSLCICHGMMVRDMGGLNLGTPI